MSKKIVLDKYYTPSEIAQKCYDLALSVIGQDSITEIIEPSAGAGVFLDISDDIRGYDIEPEDARIIQQDYLELDLEYKKGRLILGNPPYGRCLNMAQKFFKKSIELGDYIGFILPISQLNNNKTLYEFDLIYSEDLGLASYSGVKLHCVFNIYRRPMDGLNKKESIKLKEISIYRQDKKGYEDLDFDVRMCYWGNGSAGKILYGDEKYAGEYKIKIHNVEHKEEIKTYIETFDWNGYIRGIAMKRLKQYHILELLKKEFSFLS